MVVISNHSERQKRDAMKKFVLLDKSIGVFIGLKNGKVEFEEVQEKALVFDERDNMTLKVKFYNTITFLNLESVEV